MDRYGRLCDLLVLDWTARTAASIAWALIDKSIEFKASVQVHCLGILSQSPKKCDKPSFEQLWATLVHYGSPTTILSTDKTTDGCCLLRILVPPQIILKERWMAHVHRSDFLKRERK